MSHAFESQNVSACSGTHFFTCRLWHQGLVLGESESAVAAGANLMLLAGTAAAICQLQALSPNGRCKTFDASADGYGRGEGVSALVLQPAGSSPQALALLHATVVNQVQSVLRHTHKSALA